MNKELHPNYQLATIKCGCGKSFTMHTMKDLVIRICRYCHPVCSGSGSKKLLDEAGKAKSFMQKYGIGSVMPTETK